MPQFNTAVLVVTAVTFNADGAAGVAFTITLIGVLVLSPQLFFWLT